MNFRRIEGLRVPRSAKTAFDFCVAHSHPKGLQDLEENGYTAEQLFKLMKRFKRACSKVVICENSKQLVELRGPNDMRKPAADGVREHKPEQR